MSQVCPCSICGARNLFICIFLNFAIFTANISLLTLVKVFHRKDHFAMKIKVLCL